MTTPTGTRRPPAPDCNLLWASSHGTCAHPTCDRPLVVFDGGRWATLGEIAHIRAHSPDGPRFDSTWTGSADSYENCLLLCRDHHRLIDSNPDAYPVDTLLEWKRQHEIVEPGYRLEVMSHIAAPPPAARLAVVRDQALMGLGETLTTRSRVALLGLSGAGKTEMARQWLTSRGGEYSFRWWVRGHGRETLANDLASLAPLLGLPATRGQLVELQAAAVRDELSARGAWLLVVDNASSPMDLADLLPAESGHVIVTSQDQSWSGVVPPLLVPPLTDAEAIELLRRSPALDSADQDDLRRLVSECRGHPLVVDQAAGYIARTGMGVSDYTELLRTRRPETLDRSAGRPDVRFSESIQMALDQVGSDSHDILAIMAQVAPGPFEIRSVPDFERSGDPEESQDWSRFRFEDALANLRAFSLVQREGNTLVAHDLVTDVVGSALTEAQRFTAFSRAVWTLLEQLPDRPSESFEWPTMERLLPHALAVLERVEGLGRGEVFSLATVRIHDRLGVYFGGRGQHDRAREHFDRGLELMQDRGLTDSSMYGSLLHNLGNLHAELGDSVNAETLLRQALQVKERALGENALLVGISCGALGAVLEATGDWDEARRYHERAASIYRHNDNHGWTANALIDLAAIARQDDRPEDADSLLRNAIDEADLSGDAIPERVTARLRLADLRASASDLPGATKLASAARTIAGTSAAPVQLAAALEAQGRYLTWMGLEQAGLHLSRRALGVWKQVYATDPIRYGKALGNYGYGLVLAGRPDLALEPLQQSQAQLEQVLPAEDETVAVARLLTAKAQMHLLDEPSARELLEVIAADAEPGSEAVDEALHILSLIDGAAPEADGQAD
ncbi:hypothetical protein GCM10009623_34450 [Nocardioides aestuarii]|uniref:Tetratricopeptide repeat protein n=1 Tax=Nocardioides aestuarii TaxID=252231 RepID=A0ABW4TPK8_9ACTN